MAEVKTDCFGYNKKVCACTVLTQTFCKKEECSFYKTKEQYLEDIKKYERRW